MQRVLVTGVTGQIGYYVASQLHDAGVKVYGLERQTTLGRSPNESLPYEAVSGDLLDDYSLLSLLERLQPDAIFNFAAQSFIPTSWTQPILTAQYTGIGVIRLLEAFRRVAPTCRLLQAGTSELFAACGLSPQDELSPIAPRNPYGVAKAFAFHSVKIYREQYGLFACNAILYTNESPRRSPTFLFRKVTRGIAEICAHRRDHLELGNLKTYRDWGYTPDYADAAIRILELSAPDDFVIATGESHSIEELVELGFGLVGLDWKDYVTIDPKLVRPSEPHVLVGNPAKARAKLNWEPRVKFAGLVRRMLSHDLRLLGVPRPELDEPDPE